MRGWILWNVDGNAAAFSITEHGGPVWSVKYSPAGDRIVSASQDATLSSPCGILFNVTFRPDGAQLAAPCADGSVQFWAAPGR